MHFSCENGHLIWNAFVNWVHWTSSLRVFMLFINVPHGGIIGLIVKTEGVILKVQMSCIELSISVWPNYWRLSLLIFWVSSRKTTIFILRHWNRVATANIDLFNKQELTVETSFIWLRQFVKEVVATICHVCNASTFLRNGLVSVLVCSCIVSFMGKKLQINL